MCSSASGRRVRRPRPRRSLHALRWWVLAPLGVARSDRSATRHQGVRSCCSAVAGTRSVTLGLLGLAGVMAGGEFLAALAPPEAYDELAYHLPTAQAIARRMRRTSCCMPATSTATCRRSQNALTAAALAVDGIALAHALHSRSCSRSSPLPLRSSASYAALGRARSRQSPPRLPDVDLQRDHGLRRRGGDGVRGRSAVCSCCAGSRVTSPSISSPPDCCSASR